MLDPGFSGEHLALTLALDNLRDLLARTGDIESPPLINTTGQRCVKSTSGHVFHAH